MPLVSILMPAYNAAATLPAALRSVSAQTFREWELIAVNDGSGDASLEILDRAAQKDRRIRVISGAHVGHVEALRSATALASAPLLARMDADDVMHPRRLLLQVTRLDSPPHVDVLATRVRSIGHTGEGMRRYVEWQNGLLGHEEMVANFFVESPIAHPTVLMRRDLLSGPAATTTRAGRRTSTSGTGCASAAPASRSSPARCCPGAIPTDA